MMEVVVTAGAIGRAKLQSNQAETFGGINISDLFPSVPMGSDV